MRKKILVTDLLLPSGHHHFNERLVSALASISDVEFLADSYYADMAFASNVTVSCRLDGKTKRNRAKEMLRVLSNGLISAKCLQSANYGAVIISSSDPVLFPVTKWAMTGYSGSIYMIHHRSIDLLLRSRIARGAFSFYRKAVKHVVGEQFIAEATMRELGIASNNVFVWPHAMAEKGMYHKALSAVDVRRFDVVCLSGSSDSGIIDKIIEYERATEAFSKAGVGVYVKGPYECVVGNLVVSPRRLEDDEYDSIFAQASVALSLMGSSFGYRVSGSLLDAVERGCCVVSTAYPMAVDLEKKYPHVVYCEDSVEGLVHKAIRCAERAKDFQWSKAYSCEARAICSSHSQAALVEAARDALLADFSLLTVESNDGETDDAD